MANNIALFKQFVSVIDDIYKAASKTAQMDGAAELAKQGANANELIIPKIDMDGLASYSRNDGYVNGDVTLTNETVKCNYDRGRMFTVDALDDIETAGIAFGRLSGEFIRTKVVPELDAFRLSTYANKGATLKVENLTTSAQVVSALREGTNKMDEDEVPTEGRILYITPSLHAMLDDMDTTKSRAILSRFSQIIDVPQSRFNTSIVLNDGKTVGQEAGGYKAEGLDLNFIIIHPSAVIQYPKHTVNKIVTPEQNQTSDGWKFGYRTVGIADVYENKTAGIYSSSVKPSEP